MSDLAAALGSAIAEYSINVVISAVELFDHQPADTLDETLHP